MKRDEYLMPKLLNTVVHKPINFVKRLKRDFKAVVTQNAANTFTYQLSQPYDSIYIRALGANAVQLGFLNTIFNIVRSLISSPAGWLADNYRLRRVILSGLGLFIFVPVLYALAFDWTIIIIAMVIYGIGMGLAYTSCSVVCAGCLDTHDRATGKNFCGVLSSIAKILAPILASFLITVFGGLTLTGIRPIYYIQIIGYTLVFIFMIVVFKGDFHHKQPSQKKKTSIIQDFREVIAGKPILKRWIIISGLIWLPYALITPYISIFAHEVKGANVYVLGLMISASSVVPFLLGMPIGHLADRFGRKRMIYLITPFYYTSLLLLVWAPNATILIISGFLQGFYMVLFIITGTMTSELVPIEHMGRWAGIVGLFRGIFTIPAPLLGGIIWAYVNPVYVFLIPILLDVLLRLPLLATIPETLNSKIARSQTNIGENIE